MNFSYDMGRLENKVKKNGNIRVEGNLEKQKELCAYEYALERYLCDMFRYLMKFK